MLICPLDNQNSLQILFFSDSLSSACQVLPYNPVVLIPVHNGIFCAKKIGIFKKNKLMWSSILLPPAHKIFTPQKIILK